MNLYKCLPVSVLLFSLTACGIGDWIFEEEVEWKEEVRLHDGRIILVDIFTRLTPLKFPCNCRTEIDRTITLRIPGDTEVAWSVPESLSPIMVDSLDGAIYIASAIRVWSYRSEWGCTDPPFIVHRYSDGNWSRIGVADLPKKMRTANFVMSYRGLGDDVLDDGVVKLEDYRHQLLSLKPYYYEITEGKQNMGGFMCP